MNKSSCDFFCHFLNFDFFEYFIGEMKIEKKVNSMDPKK